jgi:asparagine synthetase B (glutamine-hydrolysing)
MCGIFGLVAGAGLGLPQSTLERTVRGLFLLSEARGKEAAGLACLCRGQVDYFKCPERARDMLGRQGFQSFFAEALRRIYQDGRDGGQGGAGGFGLMGHSRLVTNGLETLARNNQPVVTAHTIGVHNGIIVNEGDLWRRHPDLVRDAEIDTKVLLSLLDKFRAQSDSEEDALRLAMAEMEGSASIAYFPDRGDLLVLATNTGSLYTAHSPAGGLFLFASEGMFLRKAIAEAGLDKSPGGFTFAHLAPGRGLLVEIASCAQRGFALGADALGQRAVPAGPESPSPAGLTFLDRSPSPAKMRRCTRCILPETFPHITFDKDGVCSVCHAYEYRQREGRQVLEEFVAPYRSKNGEPDCIVAFSGGRDSSYGLHYVKKELGMNPIAFTYDWGMVTDLARRNQARICGKLGVEHIIRSPDIRFKRRNIRKNLQAWLHRPDLGMIPLFSAGDKQFYHYGRELRQATGARLTVFCADEMERSEFKTGFCGVRESQHGKIGRAHV